MQSFCRKYGPWAVVSGASSGLGRAFARGLAERGIHTVLLARREQRLLDLARELETTYGIEARPVSVDLGRSDFLDTIVTRLDGVEAGLLVNNAGFTNSGNFLDNPLERELSLLHVNCRASMVLAHHFGKSMRERGRGGIIMISSIAAFAGIPYWAQYSASKSYDLLLAESLAQELRDYAVDVLALCPGAIRTEFETYSGFLASLLAVEPEPVVDHALKRLGNTDVTVVGWANRLSVLGTRVLPRSVVSKLFGFIIRSMLKR